MTAEPTLLVEYPTTSSIAVVTLNRPKQLNALDLSLVGEIRGTLLRLGEDRSCRVVVLTGKGRGFCAGLDIASVSERQVASDYRTPWERMEFQSRFAGMIEAIRSIPQPVIAAVNGPAAGAGMAMALASDIRVLADSADLHVAAVRLGLSAGECGLSYHLPRHIGSGKAFEILLTGRPISADEALQLGLVSRVVENGKSLEAALEVADAVRANSPFAIWMTKQVMWANLDAPSLHHALELENRTQILANFGPDVREAMQAFLQKRPPSFTTTNDLAPPSSPGQA